MGSGDMRRASGALKTKRMFQFQTHAVYKDSFATRTSDCRDPLQRLVI